MKMLTWFLFLITFISTYISSRSSIPFHELDDIYHGVKNQKFRVIITSRLKDIEEVVLSSPIGKSLNRFPPDNLELVIYSNNTLGLSVIYNKEIEYSIESPAILIFVHDDLFILDYYWYRNIYIGLTYFDMIGLAGCSRRLPFQSTWRSRCDQYESGSIMHHIHELDTNPDPASDPYPDSVLDLDLDGESVISTDSKLTSTSTSTSNLIDMHMNRDIERNSQSHYGPTPQRIKLVDGLLLATYSDTLIKNNIRFDEQFDFHYYDMDISRQFEEKQLSIGTWPISVIHHSRGTLLDQHFNNSRDKYINKWKE